MKILSQTHQFESPWVLDHRHVSVETVEDLPCLRVWDPDDADRVVAQFFLGPEAARKLAAQALCAADINEWEATAKSMEAALVESRGRVVSVEPGSFPASELDGAHVVMPNGTKRRLRLTEDGCWSTRQEG